MKVFFIVCQSLKTHFHMGASFQSKISRCLSQKIPDVLKCKGGVFIIWGKLIWQSDIRSPSSCSHSVWDAITIDATASNAVSIWEEHFPKVKENRFYYITNMEIRNFNGICLTTERVTKLSELEPFEIMDTCVKEISCSPENMNGLVNMYHIQ